MSSRDGRVGAEGSIYRRMNLRQIDELCFASVLLVGKSEEQLVASLRGELSDPSELVVVRDEVELKEVARRLPCASFFAVGTGTGAGLDALRVLRVAGRAWPSIPRLWFDRQARPALPSARPPELVGVELWQRPYFDDCSNLSAHLAEACRLGLSGRRLQLAAGRAFSDLYDLPPKASLVCTAVALRCSEDRWSDFVGDGDPRQLNRYLSNSVYRRVGVNNRYDLVRKVMAFQQDWLLGSPSPARPAAS